MLSQERAPIYEALKEYRAKRIVPFDVPGHKMGRGNPELTEFLGRECMTVDVNSSKPLDNLCHPVSVIKEAEQIAAEAFGAKNAFFIVNGTTAAVQAMALAVAKRGEKIIMPRNVHRSAINALILGGAVPVYVNPGVNKELGIPLGMTVEDVEKAILENPDAKAVFVNNPTYYGVCSDIKKIADLAHAHGMYLLADEAHGTHFYFGDNMPLAGMKAGADFAAVSMHKSGGSLTQSSFLLTADTVNEGYVRQIINLMQTTSGSYLLMSSLDISRRNLALHGREIFAKLSIHTRDIGLAGIEVYDILRDRYGIQIEFGDIGNILAYVSIGDRELYLDRLIGALNDIKRIYSKDKTGMLDHEYINPIVKLSPQDAFYGNKKSVPIEQSSGKISGEFVMCYPPGIPILAPGEQITDEILAYIKYAGDKGCFLTGTQDLEIKNIMILDE